jgi:hypothetical protein
VYGYGDIPNAAPWPTPYLLEVEGVTSLKAYMPPNYPTMTDAVNAIVELK